MDGWMDKITQIFTNVDSSNNASAIGSIPSSFISAVSVTCSIKFCCVEK